MALIDYRDTPDLLTVFLQGHIDSATPERWNRRSRRPGPSLRPTI